MQRITPFLWFDQQAEEAVDFYLSVFKTAKRGAVTRYGKSGPGPEGSVMTIAFELEGTEFTALNGGPEFSFNESVSFVVNCRSQEEIDYYWDRLSRDGGEPGPCGWLKDRFGLSWQIVPAILPQLLSDKDEARVNRVILAIMPMKKLEIATLQSAFAG